MGGMLGSSPLGAFLLAGVPAAGSGLTAVFTANANTIIRKTP